MSYPTQTFDTIDEWQAWVDNNIIPNGNEEITGNDGNITENAAVKFIKQSPLNWEKAQVVSSGGVITETRPIAVFITNAPTTLAWLDNIYNQYVFVNTTGSAIPLASGFHYYDINLVAKSSIPARTIISIAKAGNGQWISLYNSAGGSSPVAFVPLQFEVGASDSPMDAGDTVLVITVDDAIEDSEFIFLDGSLLYVDRPDRISYTIVYTTTSITITFNQSVSDGQLYLIKYSTQTV